MEKVNLVKIALDKSLGNHYVRNHHTTLNPGEMFTLRGMWEQKLTEGTTDSYSLLHVQS